MTPDWKKHLRKHLPSLQLGAEREMQMIEEMAQHLEAVYEDALRNGASEHEAFQSAAAHIKDWQLLECELVRAKRPIARARVSHSRALTPYSEPQTRTSGGIVMTSFLQDLRFGARVLLKSRAFTAVAVLSLALGIGANTAIFSLINAVMLRALPVKDPQQLVLFSLVGPGRTSNSFSYPLFEHLSDNASSFEGLIAASTVSGIRMTDSQPGPGAEVETVQQAQVSSNYFSVLGAKAIAGRVLTDDDESLSNPQPVAVIAYDFWKRRFGLDRSVVGKKILLDDYPFTIVGVAEPGFFGFEVGRKPDLWWPLRALPLVNPGNESLSQKTHWWLRVIGRLRLGSSVAEARAQLDVALKQHVALMMSEGASHNEIAQRYFSGLRLELEPGSAGWTMLRQRFKKPLFILMTVVGLVLLTACANIANLLLARASTRRKEIAIRLALGARRSRIIRQLLTESILLALAGGVVGLLFAQWGAAVLITYPPRQLTAGLDLGPDTHVLGFTLIVSLLTGILFGLAPAIQSTRLDLTTTLKSQSGWNARGSRFAITKVLVVVQVALSLFLLIGAGLFVRTLQNLKDVDIGFEREHLAQFAVDAGTGVDTVRRVRLYKEVLARLEALPGARSATLLSFPLMSGNSITNRIVAPGHAPEPEGDEVCYQLWVGPRFFETMGIALVSGRDFDAKDETAIEQHGVDGSPNSHQQNPTPSGPLFAMINESMARHFFGDENPIGKRFIYDGGPPNQSPFEVIGVVKDAKYAALREAAPKTFYVSYFQRPTNHDQTFQLRTSDASSGIGAAIQHTLREIDPKLRLLALQTMDELIDQSLIQERFIAQIAGFFSLLAMLLATVGLYGIMSHTVTTRTNEIGIRMALGALRSDVVRMVLRETMSLVTVGVITGLAAAAVATRFIASMLFGLAPTDPATIAIGTLLMIGVATVAGYLPARRASNVGPMMALRYE